MQARRLPAARGTFWLFEGFRLFRRNPPLITSLTLFYLLTVQVLVLVLPGVGPVLLPVALPILTLLVANGCRLVDEGRQPDRRSLLLGIADNLPAMLRLGALQLAGAVLLVLLNLALSGGSDPLADIEGAAAVQNMGAGAPAAEAPAVAYDAAPGADAAMLGALLRLLLLSSPLILAFWFAPFLTGWDRVSPFKAVFFSAVASWRNWRAMAMFSIAAAMLAGVVPGMLLVAFSQIADLALSAAFVAMRLLLVFLVAPVLTASIYISYRDIFHSAVDDDA